MKKLIIGCWEWVVYSKAERRGLWLMREMESLSDGGVLFVAPGEYKLKRAISVTGGVRPQETQER